ncbi:hypothetical protein PUNSTDRAFT_114228 [Punctularia strigosozonata HHB-11173 SS5]|uniref:uncharacterized protein n=1 Tax=Punctularia strigosozonata (strain HHB-11173) TaxID=741275 RepID=UPI0004418385|nr:uncharacterized protein PUNSTDRAFT_114228 [Punctularia strigosozonata HHB-11173 SS5]EIN07759.1 hypothetical protein PUNSTDRAFT_114228 [Punctularia strigosozonata HHB-11173 SS5]
MKYLRGSEIAVMGIRRLACLILDYVRFWSILLNTCSWTAAEIACTLAGYDRHIDPRCSAVVVVGNETCDSEVILKLAKAGYTVFVDGDVGLATSASAHDADTLQYPGISSLLHRWHSTKATSRHKTKGSGQVIPLGPRTGVDATRQFSRDTVRAYCDNHKPVLQLLALIILPRTDMLDHKFPPESTFLSTSPGSLAEAITEHLVSLSSARDYVGLLQKGTGRIVILINSTHNDSLPSCVSSLCYETQLAAIRVMSQELRLQGIHVCQILASLGSMPTGQVLGISALSHRFGNGIDQPSNVVMGKLNELYSIARDDALCLVQQMIECRYAHRTVSIGVHPLFRRLHSAVPSGVQSHIWKLLTGE